MLSVNSNRQLTLQKKMNQNHIQNTISNIFKKSSHMKNKKSFLGIFTISTFKNMNLHLYDNCSLILFISGLNPSLGHWISVIKVLNNVFFIDSYGLSPAEYYVDLNNTHQSFTHYQSKRLQSNTTTICGLYAIINIYLAINCNYNMYAFDEFIKKKISNNTLSTNDKKLVNYMMKFIKNKNCVSLFCNSKFAINFKKCRKLLCKK